MGLGICRDSNNFQVMWLGQQTIQLGLRYTIYCVIQVCCFITVLYCSVNRFAEARSALLISLIC